MKKRKCNSIISWILTLVMVFGAFDLGGTRAMAADEKFGIVMGDPVGQNGGPVYGSPMEYFNLTGVFGYEITPITLTAVHLDSNNQWREYSGVKWSFTDDEGNSVSIDGISISANGAKCIISGAPAEVVDTDYYLSISERVLDGAVSSPKSTVTVHTDLQSANLKIKEGTIFFGSDGSEYTGYEGYKVGEGDGRVKPVTAHVVVSETPMHYPISDITYVLSGKDKDCFVVSDFSGEYAGTEGGVSAGTDTPLTFVAKPVEGLEKGVYEASVDLYSKALAVPYECKLFFRVEGTDKARKADVSVLTTVEGSADPVCVPVENGAVYEEQNSFTVSNNTNKYIYDIKIASSSENVIVAPVSASELAPQVSMNFTVKPAEGLEPGVYESTITVNSDRAEATSFKVRYTVEGSKPVDPVDPIDPEGMKAAFEDTVEWTGEAENAMVYTGSAIMPAVKVTNGEAVLRNGTDYTLSYKNNVNAGSASAEIKGKGNYSKQITLPFTIEKKNVNDDDIKISNLTVADKTKKVEPVVTYAGVKLKNKKDYTVEVSGNKVTISGIGNFTGQRTADISYADKKELEKISVSIKTGLSFVYDGTAHTLSEDQLIVKGSRSKEVLSPDQYTVSYSDNVDAGTVKVTVAALGGGDSKYTGSVTKSFRIVPAKDAVITIADIDEKAYSYTGSAVTPELDISAVLGNGNTEELESGKDYKLAFSNNIKAGKAKVKVTFIGNYKGVKVQIKNFIINPAVLDASAEVIVPEFVALQKNTKASKYRLNPGTTLNVQKDNVCLKKTEYKVKYYLNDETTEMDAKKSVSAGDVITVKAELSKSSNYVLAEGCELTASYIVTEAAGINITGFKVKVLDPATGKEAKIGYTGAPISFDPEGTGAKIVLTRGKTKIDLGNAEEAAHFSVQYANNLNKGTAYIIVTALEGDEKYSGYASGKFTIKAGE